MRSCVLECRLRLGDYSDVPFYLRKSVSAGPFRFNLSRKGVGVSVGIKGFRIGTGPRGHYVHAGRGGIYYRATIGRAGESRRDEPPTPAGDNANPSLAQGGVEMVEVDSGAVLAMRDEAFSALLDEINANRRQPRMAAILGWLLAALGLLGALIFGSPGLLLGLFALPGWAFGRWLDSYRRTSVIFYELEPDIQSAFEDVVRSFDAMASSAGKWHVEAGGAVKDLATWKRNAGASHIVKKNATALAYKLPAVMASNLTPPAVQVGKQTLYFLPDVVLIDDGGQIGAIGYPDLRVAWQDSNFIEEGNVPGDAQIVGHTWKHPNKSGGPDRRFKDNRQIPICRYEVMHLSSASGLNELLEFSRVGVVPPFADAVRKLARNASSPATSLTEA